MTAEPLKFHQVAHRRRSFKKGNDMSETEKKKQAIAVIGIQMETLAQLPAVKSFIELDEKRNLLAQTLPNENPKQKEGEE